MDFEERKYFWKKKRRSGLAQSEKVNMQEEFVPSATLRGSATGVVARVERMRTRQAESERQVNGLFESMLAESFEG